MVLEKDPQKLVPLVFAIQDRVKEHNRLNAALAFRFRTGLHCGPVFTYSENENNNFAGNGINLVQRVMNLGDDGHIVASNSAYEAFGRIEPGLEPLFHPIKEPYTVKHGESLRVYNVYDAQHGNPVTPAY